MHIAVFRFLLKNASFFLKELACFVQIINQESKMTKSTKCTIVFCIPIMVTKVVVVLRAMVVGQFNHWVRRVEE